MRRASDPPSGRGALLRVARGSPSAALLGGGQQMKTYTEQELKRHVSRAAAALVLAAGGEIRVPMRIIRDADRIELEQTDDPRGHGGGEVVYRARLTDFRRSGGAALEGEVIRRDDGAAGAIVETK